MSRNADTRARLLRWYAGARRELPWRLPAGRTDPYRTWISEVMLQQTRVTTAIPYYRRFLARFPTLRALARASEGEVLACWSGLGYYARGRALLAAARVARERFGGLPRAYEDLRALPGFGPYTAGAVASIAFGQRVPAVDGNAARVLARIFLVDGDLATASNRARLGELAVGLLGRSRSPGEVNQALMELGALICRPRGPACERCPVESRCEARRAGRVEEVPARARRAAPRPLTLAVAVCEWRGRVLLVRRAAGGLFGGLWSPPTVEVDDEASAAAAISNCIAREPSVRTGEFTRVGTLRRPLTHRALTLHVFRAAMRKPPRRGERLLLADEREMEALGIPSAMRAALGLVLPHGGNPARDIAASRSAPRSGSRVRGVGSRIERV